MIARVGRISMALDPDRDLRMLPQPHRLGSEGRLRLLGIRALPGAK